MLPGKVDRLPNLSYSENQLFFLHAQGGASQVYYYSMKKLVIVESPTKAKTISKFLGSSYIVESSLGHVRDLPRKNMGIDLDDNSFTPTYQVNPDKKEHVSKLKKLAEQSNEVIFATDEDREGEAISWHLAHILKIKPKDAKRIVFHEITKDAIMHALEHPRHIDQQLVDAQQARRILDRLVGYELSPFLWKKVARGLSAGRVQSVAVRLIVERERERNKFEAKEYWKVIAQLSQEGETVAQIEAKLHAKDGKSLDKFALGSQSDAQAVLDALENGTYTVTKVEKKEAKRKPNAPFTTSTLQQQANQKFGYSAKQTMRLAQQLYEGIDLGDHGQTGLITYMRTDSVNLSDKFVQDARSYIEGRFGSDHVVSTPRSFKNKSKGAQEAHEAIRPTDASRSPEAIKAYLSPQQHKLYQLIWSRAVATQMVDAVLDRTSLDITCNDYMFRATGQTVKSPGWLALFPDSQKEDLLPAVKEQEVLTCHALVPTQHFTEPPARYSDATLVKALEEYGIGRPSTYAPTISTIENRGYVDRDDNKRLYPLDVAMLVTDVLVEHFSAIVDYDFTANMEQNLDDIADGQKEWHPVIEGFYHPFHEAIVRKTEEVSREDVSHMRELGIDPKTNKPIYARIGQYGPFVQKGSKEDEEKPVFAPLPKHLSVETVTLEDALPLFALPKTLGQNNKEEDIIAALGRFGPYLKVGKKNYSLKEHDPYTITLEEAKQVIAAKDEADAKAIISVFEEEGITVKDGRYGPYVTDGKKNAKIPKGTDPATLTKEDCVELLAKAKTKKKGTRKKKK